jgi:hypothetical protein
MVHTTEKLSGPRAVDRAAADEPACILPVRSYIFESIHALQRYLEGDRYVSAHASTTPTRFV